MRRPRVDGASAYRYPVGVAYYDHPTYGGVMPLQRVTAYLDRPESPDRDDVQNVWHFQTAGGTPAERTSIAGALEQFYEAVGPSISGLISRQPMAHSFKFATVGIGGPAPGDDQISPLVDERLWTLNTPAAAGPLPAECCAVLSLESFVPGTPEEEGNTRPAARRRGRLYIGPLTTADVAAGPGDVFITQDTRIRLVTALEGLHATLDPLGIMHVIYSRADAATYGVNKAWVDNAVDIQRRRGKAPSTRTETTAL